MPHEVPHVYLASPLRHAAMWRDWKSHWSGPEPAPIHIVSTWHDVPDIEDKDYDVHIARSEWGRNRAQILFGADHLLAFANASDSPNGTILELGMAIGKDIPVHLVGTFRWGSWRHWRGCREHATLHDALMSITRGNAAQEGVPQ